jgi:ABC-2 type transport system permease protein
VRSSFDLYRRLIGVQIRSQLQYRFSFAMDLLSTLMMTGLWFVSLSLILERFNNIGGWKLGEIAFLYGMVESAFGVMDMAFSGFDPDRFSAWIRLGTFDQLLLRPASVTLQVLGSEFVLRRLGRIAQGIAVFALSLHLTHPHWTPLKIVYLPVVFASMVCFFGGLFLIGSTITFWTVQSIEAVNIFTYGGSEMMSYPFHIYQEYLRRFFTFVVPAVFLNYCPALYFLDKPDPLRLPAFAPFLSPFVGFGMLAVAHRFWRYGVDHYQSSGS